MDAFQFAALALGRLVFLPYQRASIKKAGLPVQNGQTYADAGDFRAVEATAAFKTGDPAGFTIIDVLAWGSLGHAAGYAILASGGLASTGFGAFGL